MAQADAKIPRCKSEHPRRRVDNGLDHQYETNCKCRHERKSARQIGNSRHQKETDYKGR
jgi:hypothetical protein